MGNIQLLDLVKLQIIKSNMELDKIVAVDDIILNSKTWFGGDWANKVEKQKDELVTRNNLEVEEENSEEGCTSGAESLINLQRLVGFDNINLTSVEIFEPIFMNARNKYEIREKESQSIQNAVIELNLLDNNLAICPPVQSPQPVLHLEGAVLRPVENQRRRVDRRLRKRHVHQQRAKGVG